jgi:hypothetical protein
MSSGRGLGILGLVALASIGLVAFVNGVLVGRQPTVTECVDRWNSNLNAVGQTKAATFSTDDVIVQSSVIKTGDGGCSVTVLEGGPGAAWTSFATTLRQLDKFPEAWAVRSGQHWGTDSPDPDDQTPNATVRPDGTIGLSG